MFSKDFFIGLAAGAVAGVCGYRLYQANRQAILDSFDSIARKCNLDQGGQDAAAQADLNLEELEKQKEHLEDLIAEEKARAAASEAAAQSSETPVANPA